MDVAIITRSVYPIHGFGGAEKHVYYVAKGLAEQGIDVHIHCLEAKDATDEEYAQLEHEHIHLHEAPYRDLGMGRLNFFEFTALLKRRWKQFNEMDVVHSHGVFPVALYSFFKQTPIVVTTHGLEEYRHPHLKYPLFPFNLFDKFAAQRNIDHFVALSEGNREDIETYLGVEDDRITEIPNGVDTDFFEPKDTIKLREQYDLKENVVVAVSRLVEYKGHGVLVQAVNEMEDTSLVIAGDGQYKEELEEIAGPDVHFAGRVDEEELPYYYSLGDVFSLPTFGEGMPLSILEAMACGTPVVSTQVGAIPDVVAEDVGRVVPPRDKDALQDALKELLSDREQLKKMSDTCRERAVDEYSWQSVAEKTAVLYEKIV